MKLRTFLKTLGLASTSVAVIPAKPALSTFAEEEKKNEHIVVDIFMTRNFLIPYIRDDGKPDYEVNQYGDMVKLCGTARTTKPPFKQLRFESTVFDISTMKVEWWDNFFSNCAKSAKESIFYAGLDIHKLYPANDRVHINHEVKA